MEGGTCGELEESMLEIQDGGTTFLGVGGGGVDGNCEHLYYLQYRKNNAVFPLEAITLA
jgi:hypothetical protein